MVLVFLFYLIYLISVCCNLFKRNFILRHKRSQSYKKTAVNVRLGVFFQQINVNNVGRTDIGGMVS